MYQKTEASKALQQCKKKIIMFGTSERSTSSSVLQNEERLMAGQAEVVEKFNKVAALVSDVLGTNGACEPAVSAAVILVSSFVANIVNSSMVVPKTSAAASK